MLGLALVVSIAGACWVAAEHECLRNIAPEVWFIPAALGGVLVGILIPLANNERAIFGAGLLVAAALAAGVVGATIDHLLALCGVGAALGGVFLGLFVPSPGRRGP